MTLKTNYYRQILKGEIKPPDRCEHPPREKLPNGSLGDILPALMLFCVLCGRRKKVERECGRPDCVRYNMKKTMKNYRRFLRLITRKKPEGKPGFRQWKAWNRVDLTGVHIPLDNFLRARLRLFGNTMKRFLDSEYPDGGVAVTEFTNRYKTKVIGSVLDGFGDGIGQGPCTIIDFELVALYVHGHAMCFGEYKDKVKFEESWGLALVKSGLLSKEEFETMPAMALAHEEKELEKADTVEKCKKRIRNIEAYRKISGGRFVDLSNVRSVYGSARYCLGYVMKGNTLPEEYWAMTRLLKLVRPWGYLYGKAPTDQFICADCGGELDIALSEFDEKIPDANPGPLKLKLVPKIETGPP